MAKLKPSILSFSLLGFFVLIGFGSGKNGPEANCTDSTSAFVMSHKFVEQRLKAPSTAKFPMVSDSGVKVAYRGECTHVIYAYVDSQNGFGAMIRTSYSAKIKYNKEDDTYSLLDLSIN